MATAQAAVVVVVAAGCSGAGVAAGSGVVAASSRFSPGALDGGSQCRMSNLRNGNVSCRYFCNFHVDFEIAKCHLSNLRNGPCHVTNIFPMSMGSMSHVDFKKWPCRPVEFKGQGPQSSLSRPPRAYACPVVGPALFYPPSTYS